MCISFQPQLLAQVHGVLVHTLAAGMLHTCMYNLRFIQFCRVDGSHITVYLEHLHTSGGLRGSLVSSHSMGTSLQCSCVYL